MGPELKNIGAKFAFNQQDIRLKRRVMDEKLLDLHEYAEFGKRAKIMKKFKKAYNNNRDSSKSPTGSASSPGDSAYGMQPSPRSLVKAEYERENGREGRSVPHFMSPKMEAKPVDRNKLKPIGNSPEISAILERPAYSSIKSLSINSGGDSPSISLERSLDRDTFSLDMGPPGGRKIEYSTNQIKKKRELIKMRISNKYMMA